MIWYARFLSLGVGFLSLSQEILWIRFSGFAYHGAPPAFSFVLSMYLLGIAVGAAIGKRFCKEGVNQLASAGYILLAAGLIDLILPWIFIAGLALGNIAGVLCLAFSLVLTSLLKSMVFPIAHHLGSVPQANKVGSSVSKVYVSNILGSTLGPIVTGFILLQLINLQQNLYLMAALTLALGALCLFRAGKIPSIFPAIVTVAGLLLIILPNELLPALINSTISKNPKFQGEIGAIIENRYGIIHTLKRSSGEEIIFGGNSYDGTSNIDIVINSNGISRAYILGALKPRAEQVLIIGLSGGTWARVISDFPGVQKIDIVEINPGYVELVKRYPAIDPLMTDPRVEIHADDGRRWLKRHPEREYDLIVMNTTQHWRAHASLLLSQDFHSVLKKHLNSGGLFAYNATDSMDAFRTAMETFKHVYNYRGMVITSDYDLSPEIKRLNERVSAMPLVKQLIDENSSIVAERLGRISIKPFDPQKNEAARELEVITDQNMLTEYKHGYSIYRFLNKKTTD